MNVKDRELYDRELEQVNKHFEGDELMLDIREVALYIGCDVRTLLSMKSFPIKKIGNRNRVSRTSLAAWLANV